MSVAFYVGVLLALIASIALVASLRRPSPNEVARRVLLDRRATRVGVGVLFGLGLSMIVMGTLRSEPRTRAACDRACREWGLPAGRLDVSKESPTRRACLCGEGDAAAQLYEIGSSGRALGPARPPASR